jgi:hypothetical protein
MAAWIGFALPIAALVSTNVRPVGNLNLVF